MLLTKVLLDFTGFAEVCEIVKQTNTDFILLFFVHSLIYFGLTMAFYAYYRNRSLDAVYSWKLFSIFLYIFAASFFNPAFFAVFFLIFIPLIYPNITNYALTTQSLLRRR